MKLWARWRGQDSIPSAIAALLVNAIIGYVLLMGLRAAPLLRAVAEGAPLALFDLTPPVQERPEPPQGVRPHVTGREGGVRPVPAPRRTAKSADRPISGAIVAPESAIAVPAPFSPVAALPVGADKGDETAAAGSVGNGGGLSGSSAGTGRGVTDGGEFSRARQTGGRFHNSDFPQSARGAGRLKIGVRYAIGPSGHIDKCEIIEGSGYAEVDAMTCRVIEERYRFRPARDPEGYAVTEVREEDYRWRVR